MDLHYITFAIIASERTQNPFLEAGQITPGKHDVLKWCLQGEEVFLNVQGVHTGVENRSHQTGNQG